LFVVKYEIEEIFAVTEKTEAFLGDVRILIFYWSAVETKTSGSTRTVCAWQAQTCRTVTYRLLTFVECEQYKKVLQGICGGAVG